MSDENEVGCPTKYKKEYCEKIIKFFDVPYVYMKSEEDKKRKKNPYLPTMEKFARSIGVGKRTLYDWAETHEEFSHSIKKAIELQLDWILNSGLFNGINTTMAIFILKNCHGWSDKQEIIQDVEISAKLDEIKNRSLSDLYPEDPETGFI